MPLPPQAGGEEEAEAQKPQGLPHPKPPPQGGEEVPGEVHQAEEGHPEGGGEEVAGLPLGQVGEEVEEGRKKPPTTQKAATSSQYPCKRFR